MALSPPRKQGWTRWSILPICEFARSLPRKRSWTQPNYRTVSPAQAKLDPPRPSSSIKFLGLGGRNGGMTFPTLAIPGYTTTLASVVRS